MSKRVLLALSGGIDSTMTAQLLEKQGYNVLAVHFRFFEETKTDLKEAGARLGIPVIEHDARKIFEKEVIGYFADLHLAGKTPSPCAFCNPNIKWKLLLQLANKNDIPYIATGHYINIQEENGLFRIYKGNDIAKDQSYYLWGLDQEILSHAITPMGGFTKEFIKQQAQHTKFKELAKRKESSGLCFANNRSCSELLNDSIPNLEERIKPGVVLNTNGEEIGQHNGYIYYTVGQKSGLALETEEKLYVTRINADKNVLEVDTWQSLYRKEFSVSHYQFANISEIYNLDSIQVKIRGFGLNPEGNCKIVEEDRHNILSVELDNPAWAPAPGQPAVFYSGDKLLGGGIIC